MSFRTFFSGCKIKTKHIEYQIPRGDGGCGHWAKNPQKVRFREGNIVPLFTATEWLKVMIFFEIYSKELFACQMKKYI